MVKKIYAGYVVVYRECEITDPHEKQFITKVCADAFYSTYKIKRWDEVRLYRVNIDGSLTLIKD